MWNPGRHNQANTERALSIKARIFHSLVLARRRCSASCSAPLMLCHPITAKGRGDPCPHSQADVWGGISFIGRMAAIFGLDGCFALECSPQAEIAHQCRRRVADQLSGGETVAGTGRPRQKGPDWQIREMRRFSMVEKGIISVRWERS